MNLVTIKRYNGQDSILISGLHNHKSSYVVEIFKWIAEHTVGSYGLLYTRDDEDPVDENRFVVWKLARGELRKETDPFLSPCIPKIEDEFDPTRND
ncbi:hypothetical protein J25TS5_09290 [Paenibacillus faecis]|uniref:Imm7 family immunity protein n=1 Tax=Paenibacillus faecis TaxID=862114 RepID=UPI001B186E70|nr:Imm7 family immunity protein [Paenibacillus faecis]GIO83997.1 hypothetical protein J25TS5_09290 [Paenibacillus faecis]